jgi:hypothetical protein
MSSLNYAFRYFVTNLSHTHDKLGVYLFFNWYQKGYTNVWINFLSVIYIFFFLTPFNMYPSESSEDEYIPLCEDGFADYFFKDVIGLTKERKKVKQEK